MKRSKSEYDREYYQKNKDKKLEARRKYYYKNREKLLEKQKLYKKNNREKVLAGMRNTNYKRKYGITADEADAMYSKGCKVCGGTHRLHIDHNHENGEIRGVLCHNCNLGIGYFKDNTNRLLAAVEYLKSANS